jgi:mono/diheme cytochrome c family protein
MKLCHRHIAIVTALVAALALGFVAASSLAADGPAASSPAGQERFFEEKVRPVLAANCQECHGAKKQESGLRLDSRAALLAGGDSGEAAIVPGDPDRSVLVKAINHAGDYQMPPKRKLADGEIAAIVEWVREGAPWPAGQSAAIETKPPPGELARRHRASHWAYQPVVRPPRPEARVGNSQCRIQNEAGGIQNSIDSFIVARLTAADLTLSPEADRLTLIRRLSFDLVGLPPSPEEVETFLADRSPDAYERLVDRLLAAPRHGERWGRHWLDVARYADTKGYAFAQERRYAYAYTYRDYVIRALNADLPYDRFLLEQLAADRLPEAEREPSRLSALGFLTTGRKFNNRHDDIDDQIDAVSRGLLGITVACARCHDHKYDAIPTEDYYSLYGVFANCSEPAELPLIASPGDLEARRQSEAYQKFEQELARLKTAADDFAAAKHQEFLDQARRQSADYLARIAAGDSDRLLAKLPFMSLDPKDLRPRLLERWRRYLEQRSRADDPVFGLWHDLLHVPSEAFAEKAQPVIARWLSLPTGNAAGQCNPALHELLSGDAPAARMDVPRIYGKLLSDAYDRWLSAGGDGVALGSLADDWRQIAMILAADNSPTNVPPDDIRQYLNRADRNKYSELQKKVESYQANSPFAPPRAMVVADNAKPTEPRVLVRGNPARPGNQVPRQFLLVLAGDSRQPFTEGSGRLELARAIVSADNPLTRRVIVNRLWMHHFGEPLVLSPSDFGIRCEPPTHPELLDELASDLLENGWSLKALHRKMVCSATYRQTSIADFGLRIADSKQSASNPQLTIRNPQSLDPENRLLWRMNRRRLELEAVRDMLLAAAEELDLSMFGRPVELTKAPFPRRRAVYGFLDRQDLPNLFRVFDIASPDSSSPRRPRTTVPQQALFFMNSPFVVEQAKALAARPAVAAAADNDGKIAALYRLVLARAPDGEELAIGHKFLAAGQQSPAEVKLSSLEQYAQLLLLTNEAMYID